jgi:ABC-type multidrug transport system, permease component
MKGFYQLVSANVKDIIRDRMSIFWFLAFPILFMLLFGVIFGRDQVTAKYSVGLVVQDQGILGESIKKTFEAVPVFELHHGIKSNEMKALKQGKRYLVVIVQKHTVINRPLIVSIYYDPGKAVVTQVLIASIRELLSEVERGLTGSPKLIVVRPLEAKVNQLKNIDYLLPGVLAMALMQLGLFGALNFVSLRERKIIRRLGATPLPRSMMLWSEIIVRLAMGLVQTVIIIAIGFLVFRVTITGNMLGILSTVILGAAVFITLGYFLVSFTKTEESASGLIQVVQFPMMFLSGIFFPIESMPVYLKPVVNAIPLTYLGDLLRFVMVGLPSSFGLWTDLAVLGGWLLVFMVLAVRFFKWE